MSSLDLKPAFVRPDFAIFLQPIQDDGAIQQRRG